jgi:hypothetical protein
MVWPNRGAFGVIGGYGLNVLKLLQDSHRCCRYAPAACPQENSQDNPASPSTIARILYRGPGQARLLCSPAASPQPRARGTPGVQLDPRASTPRDIEACRSPVCSPCALVRAKRQSVPQVRQTQGVPRACLRLAPHPPRWSDLPREGETCCVTSTVSGPRHSAALL